MLINDKHKIDLKYAYFAYKIKKQYGACEDSKTDAMPNGGIIIGERKRMHGQECDQSE